MKALTLSQLITHENGWVVFIWGKMHKDVCIQLAKNLAVLNNQGFTNIYFLTILFPFIKDNGELIVTHCCNGNVFVWIQIHTP